MAEFIEVGQKAPAFTLVDERGATVKSGDLKGRLTVLYFYPRDATPGCTKQACAFRDRFGELQQLGVTLFGISTDSADSHARFREKYALPFSLLVDEDHAVAEKFGAWREKNMYGKKSMGIQRSTFLIDTEGKVAAVWKRVRVDGHDEQVIDAVKKIASA